MPLRIAATRLVSNNGEALTERGSKFGFGRVHRIPASRIERATKA
jgi:hypothetical protein